MLYELRTYTVKPGSLGDMVRRRVPWRATSAKMTTANLRAIG
jgi:hypothetical protein